jgi:hypothetical protein
MGLNDDLYIIYWRATADLPAIAVEFFVLEITGSLRIDSRNAEYMCVCLCMLSTSLIMNHADKV